MDTLLLMGGYLMRGASYGVDTRRFWADTRWAKYHTDWVTASNGDTEKTEYPTG